MCACARVVGACYAVVVAHRERVRWLPRGSATRVGRPFVNRAIRLQICTEEHREVKQFTPRRAAEAAEAAEEAEEAAAEEEELLLGCIAHAAAPAAAVR